MPKLYVRGLVKVAETVRRELSQPLTATRKEKLRRLAAESVREVDRIVGRCNAKIDCLPAPTRRAYQFLKTVDLDSVAPRAVVQADPGTRTSVSLRGLKSIWDRILDRMAQPITKGETAEPFSSIRRAHGDIDVHMKAKGLRSGDLTAQSRAVRGWLAFFSKRENFEAYLAAVGRARPLLEESIRRTRSFQTPALIQFRPTSSLYRLRGFSGGTRIVLPTPMICFSRELFALLGEAAFNGGSKQAIVEAASGEEYRAIQAQVDALSGMEDWTGGVYRDLATSFERVCNRYFQGRLRRPRLTWSKAGAVRKFGHYDHVNDTVMISSALDHPDVPEYVLDFVMYHELLHKKLGLAWRNGRRAVHTRRFRVEERRFERYAEAEAALARLAAEAS